MSECRYALITGAASGLGRAFALRLAKLGWHVGLCDVDRVGGEAALREVELAGGRGQFELLDVTQPGEWQALADRLRGEWPALDLVVHNAGVCGAGEVGDFSLENWRWLLDVNLMGAIYGCHVLVDWLKENPRGGYIINVASAAAFVSAPAMGAYNVAKAGMVSLSETLAVELAPRVGVTVLMPAFFASQLVKRGRFARTSQRQAADDYVRRATMTADDVAAAALDAMRRRRLYVVLNGKARWLWRLKRLMPQRFVRLVARQYAIAKNGEMTKSEARMTNE